MWAPPSGPGHLKVLLRRILYDSIALELDEQQYQESTGALPHYHSYYLLVNHVGQFPLIAVRYHSPLLDPH